MKWYEWVVFIGMIYILLRDGVRAVIMWHERRRKRS